MDCSPRQMRIAANKARNPPSVAHFEQQTASALKTRRNKKNLTAAQAQGKNTGRWTDEEHRKFNEGKIQIFLSILIQLYTLHQNAVCTPASPKELAFATKQLHDQPRSSHLVSPSARLRAVRVRSKTNV